MTWLIRVLVALFILLVSIGGASATVYTVCQSGCDYTTDGIDDQVQINQAIQDASSGDTVYLSGSQYNTQASSVKLCNPASGCKNEYVHIIIDRVDNVVLQGLGKTKTTINAAHHFNSMVILLNGTYGNQLQNVTLRNFSIDGNQYYDDDEMVGYYTLSPCGIHALYTNGTTIRDIWMHVGGGGITGADADNFTSINNTVKARTCHQTQGKAGYYWSTDGLIKDCELTRSSGTAHSEGYSMRLEGNHARWTVKNNYIHDHNVFNPCYSGDEHIYLYNNIIEGHRSIDCDLSKHILFENNSISNMDAWGVRVKNKGEKTRSNFTFIGNTFWNIHEDAGFMGSAIVIANRDTNNANTLNDVLIEGNTIYDCTHGIAFDTAGDYLYGDAIIRNNIITGCKSGIWVEGSNVQMNIIDINNNLYNNGKDYYSAPIDYSPPKDDYSPPSNDPSGHSTSTGVNVEVRAHPTTVNFERISSEGQTTVTSRTGNPAGAPPSGFKFRGYFVDVSTTAGYSGSIEVCIDYTGKISGSENDLRLMHWGGSRWDDITSTLDTSSNVICGEVTSLSPFGIASTSSTPEPVGGEVEPANKLEILMPYVIASLFTLMVGVGIYTGRKQLK